MTPHDWHRAPDETSKAPCPVCGSAIAGRRLHRRAINDRFWIVRGVNATPPPVVVSAPAGHQP